MITYWETIRHLKKEQIINRIWRKIKSPKVNLSRRPQVGKINNQVNFIRKSERFVPPGNFSFLNVKKELSRPDGWNDPDSPKLWLYNLHYFDWLMQKGSATSDELAATIDLWIADNPPGLGNGWEPYPLSLRIVNWVKWALDGNILNEGALQSLAVQARYLADSLEYHLLGNHLFANAKALFAAGCFFSGSEADEWRQKGIHILEKELAEQILPDGGHFELSPVYHATIYEDVLDLLNLAGAAGLDAPHSWQSAAKRMGNWLSAMTRQDGRLPLFNDAAYGVAAEVEDLVDYARRLGCWTASPVRNGLTMLPDTGYFRYQTASYQLFGDIARIGPDYIPGHAHADMLTFELLIGGRPVIVDTGTSTYEIGERRSFERGTAAHNCVQVGGIDQSEMWAGFRVGRRARIIDRAIDESCVRAGHDGYARLGILHHRQFDFEGDRILIADKMTYNRQGEHSVVARYHLSPDMRPVLTESGVDLGLAHIEFKGHQGIRLSEYHHAPEFNRLVPALCIEVSLQDSLLTEIHIHQ